MMWRLVISLFCLLVMLLASSTAYGQERRGVTFHPATDASDQDLKAAASLAAVYRERWDAPGGVSRGCFQQESGGPEVVLVERGQLTFILQSGGEPATGLPYVGLPHVFRGNGTSPLKVLPNAEVTLFVGDVLVAPNGSDCIYAVEDASPDNPTVLLWLAGLPDRNAIPQSSETVNVRPFDISSGVETVQPNVPESVSVEYIEIAPGGAWDLGKAGLPFLLATHAGSVTVTTDSNAGLVRSRVAGDAQFSVPIKPRTGTTIGPGNDVYMPPASNLTITNDGATTSLALVITVHPGVPTYAIPLSPLAG